MSQHPPTDRTETVLEHLADFTIDGELDGLHAACELAAEGPVDVAAVLEGLELLIRRRADPGLLQQARVGLRAALQLPLIPGPACRVKP